MGRPEWGMGKAGVSFAAAFSVLDQPADVDVQNQVFAGCRLHPATKANAAGTHTCSTHP